MSHRTLPIDKIVVGERSRTEARAVESLSRSIREHSLIQPPVVRRDGDRFMLVCGMRRLAAMRSLGWTETPVTVAETINDELAALYAEGDENTEREPFYGGRGGGTPAPHPGRRGPGSEGAAAGRRSEADEAPEVRQWWWQVATSIVGKVRIGQGA